MSEQEQQFIDKLQEDADKLRLFIKWVIGVATSLFIAGVIGATTLGAAFNNYIIRHDSEVQGLIKIQDSKVSNEVVLEYIKYNDKMLDLVMDGVDENRKAIIDLKEIIRQFELKYFSSNTMRGIEADSSMYLPYFYSYMIDNEIGLY